MGDARKEWIDRLRELARDGGAPPESGIPDACAFIAGFADELGHRRRTDALLLAGALRRRGHEVALPTGQSADSVVLELWERAILGMASASPDDAGRGIGGLSETPPMLARDAFSTIEVWSESLLCALHALSWMARIGDRTPAGGRSGAWSRARLWREAAWIIEHVEPDNATRHPWGVHVFIERFLHGGDRGAALYADELLHVCRVSLGRPDRLSAWILLDAADALDCV